MRFIKIHLDGKPAGAVVALVCVLAIFLPAAAAASPGVTARQIGLGGSATASASGVEAIWANPANLAVQDRPAFSLMLFSAALGASNNSFTINQYNRFMLPDVELSASDKNEILESIPDGEFSVQMEAVANCLGLTVGPVGFAVAPRAFGSVSLAKDYFDLLLNGNALNQTYTFDGTAGESVAFLESSLSYGRGTSWIPLLREGRWGITFKHLYGIGYFEVLDSQGSLVTYPTKAQGEAQVRVRFSGAENKVEKDGKTESEYESSSGGGFGFDLGIAGDISARWSAALVLRDVGSSITWGDGTEKQFYYRVDSLTVANADEDEMIEEGEIEKAAGSFKTSLPTTFHLGFTRETPRLLLSTAYDQAFRSFAGISTTPKLTLGMEVRLTKWLPLRTHFSAGGGLGTCLGGGLGMHAGAFRFDVAALKRGAGPGGNKGGLLAFTSYMRF